MSSLASKWRSPSNIALVKYWGKFGNQIPANPSISFSLSACYTETEVRLSPKTTTNKFSITVYLDGQPKPQFEEKILVFLSRILQEAPWLSEHHLDIHTTNSFPHSSGIASSASGMSALALCLLDLQEKLSGTKPSHFFKTASTWARLGSGSASRSVYGGIVEWGQFVGMPESNDEFAVPYQGKVHPVFKDYCDYILLVETGSKAVSSSVGHGLMKEHPFSERRFLQAHENLSRLLEIFAVGDLEAFGNLVESEALTLHAMMMTSNPYFILMKPATLSIIEHIWEFRKATSTAVHFTLDAGANIHLLFPKENEQAVNEFVKLKLSGYLKNEEYICDQIGKGPIKIS